MRPVNFTTYVVALKIDMLGIGIKRFSVQFSHRMLLAMSLSISGFERGKTT